MPSGGAVSGGGAPDPGLIASLQTLQKTIASCTVRAPISGVVSQVYLGDTHMAMAGKPALVIRQDSPVVATIELPVRLDSVMEKAKDEKVWSMYVMYGNYNDNVSTGFGKYRAGNGYTKD